VSIVSAFAENTAVVVRLLRPLLEDFAMLTAGIESRILPTITEEERRQKLESLHTHTCFYLAQAYGNLGQVDKV
jgi:hypothetical protein